MARKRERQSEGARKKEREGAKGREGERKEGEKERKREERALGRTTFISNVPWCCKHLRKYNAVDLLLVLQEYISIWKDNTVCKDAERHLENSCNANWSLE
jgi:hypothetical protein